MVNNSAKAQIPQYIPEPQLFWGKNCSDLGDKIGAIRAKIVCNLPVKHERTKLGGAKSETR